MRVAIATDIHGNRQAFEAVIAAAESAAADELWCLGDLVGYGADPDACVELAARHCTICLAGNHDLAVAGTLSLEEFSRGAALAARWTQETITEQTRDFLLALQPQGTAENVGLYHASPRDPVWEYVLSALAAELCLDATPYRVSLIGHSHVALSFHRARGRARDRLDPPGRRSARRLRRRVADQPRQHRPAARRRSARGLAGARHDRLDGGVAPGRVRHRGRPGRDPRRAAARLARRAPQRGQ